MYKLIVFNTYVEPTTPFKIITYCLGFLTGYIGFVVVSLSYFFTTNKNINKLFGVSTESGNAVGSVLMKEKWFKTYRTEKKWFVQSYLHTPFQIRPARKIDHYDESMLNQVLSQNHFNASIFEIVIIVSLLSLGLFRENQYFLIPAGASIVLLFTMILMLSSAVHSWLKGWTTTAFIVLFVVINSLSKYRMFNYHNKAYGLNYDTEKVTYTKSFIKNLSANPVNLNNDIKDEIQKLNNWKSKNTEKPVLTLIHCSGGGSRSSLWTLKVIQYLDSITNYEFFKHAHLITGSSGGMIGAAYYRELYLRKVKNNLNNITQKIYIENIAKDMLNPIAFCIATNDYFIRFLKYNDGKYTYLKDRGYAFEKQLNENTGFILDKKLKDYKQDEYAAQIPTMILSPTIIKDGRRLLISSSKISYLTQYASKNFNNLTLESIEFSRLFEKQDAENLHFTSALRMSATFPYIMPQVSLPTVPEIDLIDAGMRDNYGLFTTIKYLNTFKDWINENTSGVLLVCIRDKEKEPELKEEHLKSISENLITPIGSLYDNLFTIQDYNFDEMLRLTDGIIKQPVNVVNFEIANTQNEISLSWHLTTKEKNIIINSIYSTPNQKAAQKVANILNN
ncbi:MAG: hypothetical protein Kow0079_11510 [Vicingaceae bacterium]